MNDEEHIQSSIADFDQLSRFRALHPPQAHTHAGVRWEYLLGGSGSQTILILPGLLGIAEMSFQQMQALEDKYRVLVPSYPSMIAKVDQLLDGIAALLDAEGIERTHALGGSYGGMMAQRLVRHIPGRVDRLILSHTGVPEVDREKKNRRFIFLLQLLPMSWLRNLLRQATRKSLEDAPEVIPFWEDYTSEIVAAMSKADLLARYRVAADFDATSFFSADDLRSWPGKVLILEGDDDPVAETTDRETLKALYPQAQVHSFHGSGHIASIAKIDEYIAVIKAFLAS